MDDATPLELRLHEHANRSPIEGSIVVRASDVRGLLAMLTARRIAHRVAIAERDAALGERESHDPARWRAVWDGTAPAPHYRRVTADDLRELATVAPGARALCDEVLRLRAQRNELRRRLQRRGEGW